MKSRAAAVLILAIAIAIAITISGSGFAFADAKPFLKNLCAGKATCGLIFVAPWCPYCKKAAPTYRQYLLHGGRYPDSGLQVVVGAGKPRANTLTAQNYGSGAIADNDGRIQKRYGIGLYPSYFVLDADRHVLLRGDAAKRWINQRFH